MVHITRPEGSLLYTGDFKLRDSLTVERPEPVPADFLVMESTYGQPFFRFPPREQVVSQLLDHIHTALREGRQPIVMGYSLGKAQEITPDPERCGLARYLPRRGPLDEPPLRNLRRESRSLSPLRRRRLSRPRRGIAGRTRRAGRAAELCPQRLRHPLREPAAHRPHRLGMLKNAQYRYGVDHVLPLSDHADFDELLELIDRVHPRKIFTHHGYPEFVDILRSKGLDAELACPDPQMQLW